MYKFNQAFVDRLKTYGVSADCNLASVREAIAFLDGEDPLPDANYDQLSEDVEALEWVVVLLDATEEFLSSSAEMIAIALSVLDEPSKNLVLDKLEEYFKSQIKDWNWELIETSATANAEPEFGENYKLGREYLGTVFSLVPSGKSYTAWANSNVSEVEASVDECWYEALSAIAESHGMSIENGEGDPCDLFAVICIDNEEDDEDESV